MFLFFPPETKQSCQLTLPALPQLQRVAGAASSRQETSRKRQETWGEAWDSCSMGSRAKQCLEPVSSHRSRERQFGCLLPPVKHGAGKLRALAAWRCPGNLGFEAVC